MQKLEEIYWAAGFLEGEGTFYHSRTPSISASQTYTLEPLKNLQNIFGGTIHPVNNSKLREKGKNAQDSYRWQIHGTQAIIAMFQVYKLMSAKRQAQIENVFQMTLARGNVNKVKEHPFDTLRGLLKVS